LSISRIRVRPLLHLKAWPARPEVVKTEKHGRGDSRPPACNPGKPDNDPCVFPQFNANKKSLTTD